MLKRSPPHNVEKIGGPCAATGPPGAAADARQRGLTRAWVIAALVAVIVVGGGLAAWTSGVGASAAAPDPPAGADWFNVQPRSFNLDVIASGELEAKNKVEIKSKVKHHTTVIDIVDEGKTVHKGDMLVKLDDEQILEDIEQAKLDVESAKSDKITAEQNLKIERNDADSAERAAKVKLQQAQLALSQWQKGTVPQKKRELSLALDKAQRQKLRARRDYKLNDNLYDQKFISYNDLDDSYVALIDARDALKTAKLNIEVYNSYTYKMDKQDKQSAVDQARADYQHTVEKNKSTIARMQSNVASRARRLAIRQQRLEEKKQQLEACTIRAPQDGLVVYASSVGSRRRRNDPIQPGSDIRYREKIILLPDTSQMMAAVNVHEAQLSQVRDGQPVTVSIDARPGESAGGKVAQIAVTAEDGGWLNPQLREYKVRVALPEGFDNTLKPAMRCKAKIRTGRVEHALAVPVQAVFANGAQHYCYIPAPGDRVRRQPIKVGRASEDYAEVTDGLSPGDRVLLHTPRPGRAVGGQGPAKQPAPAETKTPARQPA